MPFTSMPFEPTDSFGPEVAATYDDQPRGDEEVAVARLAALAGEGPALELAVGTGRLALPLAATGLRVDGVELSAAMIERLRAKPGGAELTVVQGDMATVDPMYGLRQDRDGVDQYVDAGGIGPDGVRLEVGRFDRATQRVDKCHVSVGAGGISLGPIALRHVWPSELDLMARLAGLRLRERHGGWAGEPFDGRSLRHVSVYGRG